MYLLPAGHVKSTHEQSAVQLLITEAQHTRKVLRLVPYLWRRAAWCGVLLHGQEAKPSRLSAM